MVWVPAHKDGNLWISGTNFSFTCASIAQVSVGDTTGTIIKTINKYEYYGNSIIEHNGSDLLWIPDYNETILLIDDGINESPGWITFNHELYTVEPGASRDVNFLVNTSSISPGEHKADIVVHSNDPNEPILKMPINMQVDSELVKISDLKVSPNPTFGSKTVTITANLSSSVKIAKGEYFVDYVGLIGSGIPLIPIDGIFDETNETIEANFIIPDSWTPNTIHQIYVRGMNANHDWGYDKTVELNYAFEPNTITVISGEHGTITPDGNILVEYYTDQTFIFEPEENYHVKDVIINGVSMGTITSHTIYKININYTIEAIFEKNNNPPYADAGDDQYVY